MAELNLNLSDYKASGVYYLEIDNTIIEPNNTQTALRMATGFNMTGVFNRPVYLAGPQDCDAYLGPINRRLEKRGCFSNRNMRTMAAKTAIYALNLLPVNTVDNESNLDTVGIAAISLDPMKDNIISKSLFAKMFDRSKFWIADDKALLNAVVDDIPVEGESTTKDGKKVRSSLYSFGNCSTKDYSIIMRKAEGLTGYNVTFEEWYGSADDIPYPWINPKDYVSDYFVQVIAISGNWDPSQYAALSVDPVWKEFFTVDGIKKEKLSKFLRLDAVKILFNYTGCILPDFVDKNGFTQSIDYKINKNCNKTGVLFAVNDTALETLNIGMIDDGTAEPYYDFYLDITGDGEYTPGASEVAPYKPDLMGMHMTYDASLDASISYDFMSYHMTADNIEKSIYTVENVTYGTDSEGNVVKTEFVVTDAAPSDDNVSSTIKVGDYVRNAKGGMSRIIKKRSVRNADPENGGITSTFTATDIVKIDGENGGTVEIHTSFAEMYDTLKFLYVPGLKLTNRHMPGFDKNGNIDYEAGVDKIYEMLDDPGISRGLCNKDALGFIYLVDTMGYGLKDQCGAKARLTRLADKRGGCSALCNLPSISQFAMSDAPFFGANYLPGEEPRPIFDTKYIPEGGNTDMTYDAGTEYFSLPNVANGSKNSAFFGPFLTYADGNRTILVPPAADVSNTFMDKYISGDKYKVVANTDGKISNTSVTGVEYDLDDTDRGYLEPFGVNSLVERNGSVVIYGDRTAYQDVNSDMNYLHTREILNYLEFRCRAVLADYVYKYNTPTLRAEITTRLDPILKEAKDAEAILKYEIQIDENNNTKELINEKFCIVDIAIWVNQTSEKIVTRITLNRSTAA